jgi:regulator of sirC expression with transglutaminase-like and TPR domain
VTVSTRDRFASVVRASSVDLAEACLLIASEADPELSVREWLDALDELAAGMGAFTPPGDAGPVDQADALRAYLGDKCGFSGEARDYRDVRSSLLHEVLRRRRGLPILLSVVWLEVARRHDIPAYGIGAPGHFLVGIGLPGSAVVVDPFNGGVRVDGDDIAMLVEDAAGVPLHPGHLDPATPIEILQRILTNIRAGASQDPLSVEGARTSLWAVELSLLLPHHPLALRREHGEALMRLGEFVRAADELDTFAEAVSATDPVAAEAAERLARMSRSRLN